MKLQVSARTVHWAAILLSLALAAAGCSSDSKDNKTASSATPSGAPASASMTGTLTVLDWAGYEEPAMFSTFHKKYPDVSVRVAFGESDADIYAKVKAKADTCVYHFYTGWQDLFVRDGLAAELDTSKLNGWSQIPERFKKLGQLNGKQYFVPWDWGYSSVLYRTDKVPGGIDSWTALFDPKYKGHVAMWDDAPGAVRIASYIKGYDESKLTDEQLAEIEKMWTEQKKLNLFYWTGEPELVQGMASGEIWVAYAWQGAYNILLKQGIPVAYANPKEQRNSWVGLYGITPWCKAKDLATAFLDEKLTPEVGINVINAFAYGHPNPAATQGITNTLLIKALSLDDPTVLERTRFMLQMTEQDRVKQSQLWARVKAAN
jgi:spermidine/putrescine transport system substrate-binding protein